MRSLNLAIACLITAACLAPPPPLAVTATPTLPAATATTRAPDTATPVPPSLTPTPHPTTSLTPTSYPTVNTPTDTPDLSSTGTVEAVVTAYPAKTNATYPSPDGQWRVDVVGYNACPQVTVGSEAPADRISYTTLMLVNRKDGSARRIADQVTYCGGLGAWGLDGLFWSANSRYFYYTDAAYGGPDGCNFGWIRPMIRLDVAAFKTEYRSGYISPDHTRIASWEPDGMVIWDINSDEAMHLPLAGAEGYIIGLSWSPDGQSIAYLQMALATDSYCPPVGKTSVVRVDLATQKQTVVLVAESPGYSGIYWDKPNSLRLSDYQGNQWTYNLITQELTQES